MLPDLISRKYSGVDDADLVAIHTQPLTQMSTRPWMQNTFWVFVPLIVLYLFGGIAATILFAACFNYVGFSVARSMQRAREVGVRQVVGAARGQIRIQFLVESVVVALSALVFAGMIFGWLVDGFNRLWIVGGTGIQIVAEPGDIGLISIFCVFGALVGLVAGAYPALVMSAMVPSHVIKGTVAPGNRRFALRKILIVTQFVLSFIFVTTTVLTYRQIRHVLETDLGFNQNNLINVRRFDVSHEVFRNALAQHPSVVDVSGLSILTGSGARSDTWLNSDRVPKRKKGYIIYVDDRTIENIEVVVSAGRTFRDELESPHRTVLNEVATRQLGFDKPQDAIGKMVTVGDEEMQVIGVVKDFHFYSALTDVRPLVLLNDTKQVRYANVRFLPEDRDEVVTHIERTWAELGSNEKAEFELYEQYLDATSLELRVFNDTASLVGTSFRVRRADCVSWTPGHHRPRDGNPEKGDRDPQDPWRNDAGSDPIAIA